MACRCAEVAYTRSATATLLPLKRVVEIATEHSPDNRVATVKAIRQALHEVQAIIDAMAGSEKTPQSS